MSSDIVVSSFSCFCVEVWSSFSGTFLFSDFVFSDFACPSQAEPFCQTETVCPIFPSTNLEVSGEACLRSIVLPFSIDLGDHRLDARCAQLVLAHLNHTQPNAAGISPPAEILPSFAATQAAWRFFNNPNVTPSALVQPLRQFAQDEIAALPASETGNNFVLGVIDWSKIDYKNHTAKKDVVQLTHKNDIGYELTTLLLVNSQTGLPIAPIEMYLKTSETVYTTGETPVTDKPHLEQVLPLMESGKKLQIPRPIIYVIDREADSLWYWRQWVAAGHQFIVRGDDDRLVYWQGQLVRYKTILATLDKTEQFQRTIELEIQGRKCYQEVAEVNVTLDRPANHKINGKRKSYPGQLITLRLVISRIRDRETHESVSEWYLLTNTAPSLVPTSSVALSYYYRWNIETYFKQMKSAGLEMEHWQQQTGLAIMMRLLVASMAVTVVWHLLRLTAPEATEFKNLLVRLSGKTHKRKKPYTTGILLSGLFVLLRIFDFLESCDYDIDKIKEIRNLIKRAIPP